MNDTVRISKTKMVDMAMVDNKGAHLKLWSVNRIGIFMYK